MDNLKMNNKLLIDKHICPECGERMRQVDSSKENDFTFIWWECPKDNCFGQWLEKKKA